MSARPLLRVQHLTLSFGSVRAIDDLSFTVREAEIAGLIGPEGAGKTSVLDCITGFHRPDAGRIELYGGPAKPFLLERMEICRIAGKARVIRTFRNPRLFGRLTVLENILVAQHARRFPAGGLWSFLPIRWNRKAVERARHWLDRLGLSHAAGRKACELSAPMQRRLEIARAAASGPRLLCMDEPEIGLTMRERDQLGAQLFELKQNGIAILLTGQDMRMARALCDRVFVLDRGVCVGAGNPRNVCDSRAVQRAWLGVPPGRDVVPRIHASC